MGHLPLWCRHSLHDHKYYLVFLLNQWITHRDHALYAYGRKKNNKKKRSEQQTEEKLD